jgi:hypothetical protein
MTLTLWIHRSHGSDILVKFPEEEEEAAYKMAIWHMINDKDSCYRLDYEYTGEPIVYNDKGYIEIGQSANYQFLLSQLENFHPRMYNPSNIWPVPEWSLEGYVLLSKADAYKLALGENPEGFTPGESQAIWLKETRTHAELDAELDDYMKQEDSVETLSDNTLL